MRLGNSRISVSTPEGTKVLEGALRNAFDSSGRIGDNDLPREGIVLPAVGGSDGAPESMNSFGFGWIQFCDDLRSGMVVFVLSNEGRRYLEGGSSISRQLWSIL